MEETRGECGKTVSHSGHDTEGQDEGGDVRECVDGAQRRSATPAERR